MTPSINPIIATRLAEFSRRRKRLILIRGVCGSLAVLLGSLIVVALLDRLFVLPDWARLLLSFAAYGAAAGLFWWACGRLLTHLPGPRELARLVELARPDLREDLVSAVELGENGGKPRWDSDVFRAVLQRNVAERIGPLRVEALLSEKMIAGWLRSALIALALFLVLVLIPGLRFGELMLRAMLPLANLGRVSRTQIMILSPQPADQLVPEGDSVPVTVQIRGREASRVLLETFREGQRVERTPMSLTAAGQFSSPIQVGRGRVHYRVRAGDALTAKHLLDARPRPRVVQFRKTYRFPKYTRLDPRTVEEDHGDLVALEGTEVDLDLAVDQLMQEATLQVEQGSVKYDIPLEADGSNRYRARVPLRTSGTYHVHLVAADTAFDNPYSPRYELRALADLVPYVKIDEPQPDQIEPPDGIVDLRGTAKDELGLDRIVQMIQVNNGPWQEVSLARESARETTVTRRWDLLDLGLQPGDHVLTKLVATDTKGQRGESDPVRLTISAPGFDPQQQAALAARREVQTSLRSLRDSMQELERKTAEARRVAGDASAEELARQQAVLDAANAAEAARQAAEQAQRRVEDALPQMRSSREASDLVLAGRAVSQVNRQAIEPVAKSLQKAAANAEPAKSVPALSETAPSLQKAQELTRIAAEAHQQLLASEESAAAVEDLKQLGREQQKINEQAARTPLTESDRERLTRRQDVAAKQAEAVAGTIDQLARQIPEPLAGIARQTGQNLAAQQDNLEKALPAGPASPELTTQATQMQRAIEGAVATLAPVDRQLAERANQARAALEKQLGRAAVPVEELRQAADQLDRAEKQLAEQHAQNGKPDQLEAIARQVEQQAGKVEDQWQAAVDQLGDRAALEERRRDADVQFVADAARAAEALDAVREARAGENQMAKAVPAIEDIAEAVRRLEAGHELAELTPAIRQLAAQERWEQPEAEVGARRPKDWQWIQDRLQALPNRLAEAQLPAEAAQPLAQAAASPEAQQVQQEMTSRQATGKAPVPVAEPLDTLANQVAQAAAPLQGALDQARADLAKSTPPLSERLAGLARAADELAGQTQSQAQPEEGEEPTDVRAAARGLLEEQRDLGADVAEMRKALQRDANAQDLSSEPGRARARDADDAMAMLREPPARAEDLLQEAATSWQPASQQNALKGAAQQQQQLARALEQVAQHYENVEQGRGEETREALRQAEAELGLKPILDAAYTQAEMMQGLAEQAPEQMIGELEKILPTDPAMQRELAGIAQDTLEAAAGDLQQAAGQEKQVAGDLEQLAQQQARQEAGLAEQARRIAEEAQRLAQQEVPAIRQESAPLGVDAREPLDRAKQALEAAGAQTPTDLSKPSDQLSEKMAEQVAPLSQAGNDLAAAAKQIEPATAKAQEAQARSNQQLEAARAAEAAAQQAMAKATNDQTAALQAVARAAEERATAEKEAAAAGQAAAAAQTTEEQQAALARQQAAQEQAKQAAGRQGAAEAAAAQATQALENARRQLPPAQQAVADAARAQGQAEAGARQAQGAQQRAQQASQQAGQLAQQAKQVADALRQMAAQNTGQMNRAADQQPAIAAAVREAGTDIERAGRHEERLGRIDAGEQLQALGGQLQGPVTEAVGQARQALEEQARPAAAKPAVQSAQAAIERPLSQLAGNRESVSQPLPAAPPAEPVGLKPTPASRLAQLSADASRWMARALDRLDAAQDAPAGTGQTANPPGQSTPVGEPAGEDAPGESSGEAQPGAMAQAMQAMQAAAQAQAAEMRAARVSASTPGNQPWSQSQGQSGGGAAVVAEGLPEGALPELINLNRADWGKLPPQLARDLRESQRESVASEYRDMVETYFRVIAEKAREKE